MLQSSQRTQQHPTRRTENPILAPKPDSRRRVQRQTPPSRLAPKQPRQQQQQHRRHLSVPDNVLMSIAQAQCIDPNLELCQIKTPFGGNAVDAGEDRQQRNNSDANNLFLQQQQRRPRTPPQPIATNIKFEPVTPRSRFSTLVPEPHDASQLIDDLLSFGSPTPIVQSPVADTHMNSALSPQSTAFHHDITRAQTYPQPHKLPTPPQNNTHGQALGSFDMASLTNPNFVSMAALSMPIKDEVKTYYTPPSGMTSPNCPSGQPSPETAQFDGYMPPVPEEVTEQPKSPMIKVAPLNDDGKPARGKSRKASTSILANDTGISLDEISMYISGPESSDGKWVCLYADCNKRFGRKENIKSHVQTHLGDRQFQCQVCQKCFVRQHDLKRHAKIHSGIKPYPCKCGNSFARHDALTRHRQRGMCIGAFEGVVRKVAKRGRPRKRPLEEGEEAPKPKKYTRKKQTSDDDSSTTSSSYSGSDTSTPRDYRDLNSPTPSAYDHNYESSVSHHSVKEESPELLSHSSDYTPTPPTSPPEFYDFDDFDAGFEFQSYNEKQPSESESGEDELLFSQEMFGLTALERDPSILGLGNTIFIKPEMLNSS